MVVTRRQFIAGLAVGGAAASFGIPFALGVSGSTSTGRSLVSRAPLPDLFTRQLRIPPVLAPVRSDSDGDHYEITQRVATAEILPGLSTTIWGYNGIFPGPTIESRSGSQISVTHINELPVPTVVHLHGGRTPPEHDGYPIDFGYPSTVTYRCLFTPESQATSAQVSGFTGIPSNNPRRPFGITTTAWISPARASGRGSLGSTSSATTKKTLSVSLQGRASYRS